MRLRLPQLGAALAAALCLASCGSGSPERRAAPQPKLPLPVAAALAEQSDRVAAALEAGDSCQALSEARRLQQDTIQAINERRVPTPFQEHLSSAVGDLVLRIECVPPADEERGKGKGKHKGKGKQEGDD